MGVSICLMGIALTLDNLGLYELRGIGQLWPIVPLSIGALTLMYGEGRQDWIKGTIWLALGTFFLVRRPVVLLHDVLPLLLVALGGYLVWRARSAAMPRQGMPPQGRRDGPYGDQPGFGPAGDVLGGDDDLHGYGATGGGPVSAVGVDPGAGAGLGAGSASAAGVPGAGAGPGGPGFDPGFVPPPIPDIPSSSSSSSRGSHYVPPGPYPPGFGGPGYTDPRRPGTSSGTGPRPGGFPGSQHGEFFFKGCRRPTWTGPGQRPSLFALMSGVRRQVTGVFSGAEATAIMGGVELDLRHAGMAGEEVIIDTFALWGGIEIWVPVHWHVVMQGLPLMGAFEDKTQVTVQGRQPRLIVRGIALMGGVEIKN